MGQGVQETEKKRKGRKSLGKWFSNEQISREDSISKILKKKEEVL